MLSHFLLPILVTLGSALRALVHHYGTAYQHHLSASSILQLNADHANESRRATLLWCFVEGSIVYHIYEVIIIYGGVGEKRECIQPLIIFVCL